MELPGSFLRACPCVHVFVSASPYMSVFVCVCARALKFVRVSGRGVKEKGTLLGEEDKTSRALLSCFRCTFLTTVATQAVKL